MLNSVTLRGRDGRLVWGYHTAAECQSWTIASSAPGVFTLSAQLRRADVVRLRQRPLKFTAPRKGGFFCWPVLSVNVGAETLAATLGPPEY